MIKQELAALMRKEFKDDEEMDVMDKIKIDGMSDDAIVSSPVSCSCCGDLLITQEHLDKVVEQAKSADHFFDLCDLILDLMEHELKN